MTFKVNVKIYHILIIQFKPTSVFIKRLASSVTETVQALLRIAQYDLVESIKNTNTEACSDDLSSDRLSSFIFKAVKMHSSGVHFSFGQNCSSVFPIQCQCLFSRLYHSIWRGATKSIKYLVSFLSGWVSAFDEQLATLVDDSSLFLLTSIWIMS